MRNLAPSDLKPFAQTAVAAALAVAAGAILQVIVEVGAYLMRTGKGQVWDLASPTAISGIMLGIAAMYTTGMFVKVRYYGANAIRAAMNTAFLFREQAAVTHGQTEN